MSTELEAPTGLRLRADWRRVLRHAWSIRFALLAALFSGLEVACSILTSNPPFPPATFAACAGVVTMLAAVARLCAQRALTSGSEA